MVLSIFGIALILTGVGVFAYTIPAVSQSFLNGQQESIRIVEYIFAGPLGTIGLLTLILYSAGFILFGVAIWRSGTLPRWAGMLVASHAPLLSGPFSVVGTVLGAGERLPSALDGAAFDRQLERGLPANFGPSLAPWHHDRSFVPCYWYGSMPQEWVRRRP